MSSALLGASFAIAIFLRRGKRSFLLNGFVCVREREKEGRKGGDEIRKQAKWQLLAKDDYSSLQGRFLHANDRTVNKRLFGSAAIGRDPCVEEKGHGRV